MPRSSRPADSPSAAPSLAEPGKLSRVEGTIVVLGLLVLAVLRWFSVTSHRWNSDEAQHLHVVWAWTAGLLQDRDVFDNHTPLFHILCAPLLSWLGERADIILPMRRAMIPLFAVSVWCVYRLGTLLYDRRTGWFAALLAAFLPAFFFRMGEYRTDDLWATLWLATLVVALAGEMTPWRIFSAALLLGAAFSVSMKTTLLVLCLLTAGGITWQLAGRPISKAWPRYAAAFVAGLVIVPGLIVAYFASQGALQPLYHCVIEHNTMPGRNLGSAIVKQIFSHSTLWVIPVVLLTWTLLPGVRREPARGYRRLFLFLVAGLFYPLLRAFWPIVTTQDYLPWMPLLPIFAVAGIAWLREFLRPPVPTSRFLWVFFIAALFYSLLRGFWPGVQTDDYLRWLPRWPIFVLAGAALLWALLSARFHLSLPWVVLPALLLAGEITEIVIEEPPLERVEDRRIAHLAEVLRLVDPGEYVFDLKGETIFRPRPCYLVLESLTIEQLKSGQLPNDIIAGLLAHHTAVARLSDRMPADVQRFIERHYIRIHRMWVLGERFATVPNTPVAFEVVIPERYAIVAAAKGGVAGTLDGQPIDGPRWLEAGRHELIVAQPAGEISVIWARVLERGFSPYAAPEPKEEKE